MGSMNLDNVEASLDGPLRRLRKALHQTPNIIN